MPIKISKSLRDKLPASERDDIEAWLVAKAGGVCFLCAAPLKEASDSIVADHDLPEAAGGKTTRDNLNLVHDKCNAFKKATPSVDVRPFLKLRAFAKGKGDLIKYGATAEHFGAEPSPTAVMIDPINQSAGFEFADGTKTSVPIHTEKNQKRDYQFSYVEVPRRALYNDDDCQPRNIKFPHVWSIYLDLLRNPLHEAPGCRLDRMPNGNLAKLLMFDGQHKTIAMWLGGRPRIVVKVYFDLPVAEAIELVNSVQSRIKKLPLSPFELIAKLADEWRGKWDSYESAVGSEHASEEGFLTSVNVNERSRAKQALHAAIVQDIVDDPDLKFRSMIETFTPDATRRITEAAFKRKVLDKLVSKKPLDVKGEAGNSLRRREQANIVRILNLICESAFETDGSPQAEERARRMIYQSALEYVSVLTLKVFRQHVLQDDDALLEKTPTADQWIYLEKAVQRICKHPVWTAPFASSEKMKTIEAALSKNQDAAKAFKRVLLKEGYAHGNEAVEADCVQDD